MRVLITGGAGFIGQRLIADLLARGIALAPAPVRAVERVVCLDQAPGELRDPRLDYVAADIAQDTVFERVFKTPFDLVVHLAAVVSGTAEADFELGMRVNLDGTRRLLDACRVAGNRPRLLFSSSVAVFGGELPAVVDDRTTPTPQGSYGIQKYVGEQLVQDYTRKGYIDGRSVRVPTVVVRPGAPNGAASGFASGIVREPLAGKPAVLPVDPSTEMWIASPGAVISMLRHAIELDATDWGWLRSLNLPGLTVSMSEALDALARVGGPEVRSRVSQRPDPGIERLVRGWAGRFDTARARSMGFVADPDFESIIRAYMAENPDAIAAP